jgi:hypothetical protein
MSGLLYGVGAFAVVAGAVMIGFGIPVNEFSFGNTLIVCGVTALVGGLIVIGLAVVVAQLQRIAEALASRAPIRSSRPLDMFESAPGQHVASGRPPFPPKPRSDAGSREQHQFDQHPEAPMRETVTDTAPVGSFAPTLRNPDEAPAAIEDDVSLSPQHPMSVPMPAVSDFDAEKVEARQDFRQEIRQEAHQDPRDEPKFDAGWRPLTPPRQPRAPETTYFDAMWPSEPAPAKVQDMKPAESDTKPYDSKPYEPRFEPPSRETTAVPAKRTEPDAPKPRPASEPRAVAILKSGVVDGMGYTLYVDGSIEAELPQGTLRFASINELRSHLEKNP